jgi:hypothetical protein
MRSPKRTLTTPHVWPSRCQRMSNTGWSRSLEESLTRDQDRESRESRLDKSLTQSQVICKQ